MSLLLFLLIALPNAASAPQPALGESWGATLTIIPILLLTPLAVHLLLRKQRSALSGQPSSIENQLSKISNPPLLLLSLSLLSSLLLAPLPQVSYPAAARILLGLLILIILPRLHTLRKPDSSIRIQHSKFNIRPIPIACSLLTLLIPLALLTVDWTGRKLPFLPVDYLQNLPDLLLSYTLPLLGERLSSLLPPRSVHPNVMAGALLLLLPFPLAALLFPRPLHSAFSNQHSALNRLAFILQTLAYAFLSLLTLAVILLTKSRGAYLGLAAALLVLPACRLLTALRVRSSSTRDQPSEIDYRSLPSKRRGLRSAILLICLICAVFGVCGYLLAQPAIGEGWAASPLLAPLRPILAAESDSAVSTLQGRLEIWDRALAILRDFPLSGIGPGAFTPVADAVYPFLLNGPGTVTHAHNLFLQIAVELGLPGLLAWLWLLLLALRNLLNRGQRTADSVLTSALLASLAALLVHGIFDAVAWSSRPALIPWVLLALALAPPPKQKGG